jgi:hypothetical protein
MTDIAMQTRCIYCKREQYAMAVYDISHSKAPCVWCGETPPVLTNKEWHEKIAKPRKD